MSDPYRSEAIQVWVSDFLESSAARAHRGVLLEVAPQVLIAFLESACAQRDVGPDAIEEGDLKPALLEGVAPLALPGSVRGQVPALCATFLETMEAQGRLGGGRSLALVVRALAPRYVERAGGKGTPITKPGAKLGRNEACPCGSGLKYKRCCLRRLD